MKRALLTTALLLAITTTAWAYKTDDLQELDVNEYAKVSVFKDSLEKDNNIRKAWVFFAYTPKGTQKLASSGKYAEPIQVATAQWLYNCDSKQLKVLDTYYINEAGDETKMTNTLDTVTSSAIERVRSYVCR